MEALGDLSDLPEPPSRDRRPMLLGMGGILVGLLLACVGIATITPPLTDADHLAQIAMGTQTPTAVAQILADEYTSVTQTPGSAPTSAPASRQTPIKLANREGALVPSDNHGDAPSTTLTLRPTPADMSKESSLSTAEPTYTPTGVPTTSPTPTNRPMPEPTNMSTSVGATSAVNATEPFMPEGQLGNHSDKGGWRAV